MKAYVTGGGWITAAGYGRLNAGNKVDLTRGKPALPPVREIFKKLPTRFGRFDSYTRLGWSGVALALNDSGLLSTEGKKPVSLIISSRYGCFETDVEYYKTTLDEDGELSSSILFSYTLPNIILGECAAHFGLTGATFSLGESGKRGIISVHTALTMIEAGETEKVIAGWLESIPEEIGKALKADKNINGTLIVVLETDPAKKKTNMNYLSYTDNVILLNGEQRVKSILDLF